MVDSHAVKSRYMPEIRNIFCIGRNYAEHARELNNAIPKEPVVFLKPTSSICANGQSIVLPSQSQRVDHEVEVVIVIGKTGKNISASDALDYIGGYGVGIDVTARDLQEKAKEKALPWAVAKGFDTFAAISPLIPPSEIKDPLNLDFSLLINGDLKQKGNTSEMLFSIPTLISFLSGIFTLTPGDLIFTGTPPGVGPLHEGDKLVATLGNGLTQLEVPVRRS